MCLDVKSWIDVVSAGVAAVLFVATVRLAHETSAMRDETQQLMVVTGQLRDRTELLVEQGEMLDRQQREFSQHEGLRPRVRLRRVLPMPRVGSVDQATLKYVSPLPPLYKVRVFNDTDRAYRVVGTARWGNSSGPLVAGDLLPPAGHLDVNHDEYVEFVDLRFKPEGFECPCGRPADDHWSIPSVKPSALGYTS